MIERAVMLLPHPLSPTRQRISFGYTSRDRPRTMSKDSPRLDTEVRRSRIESSGVCAASGVSGGSAICSATCVICQALLSRGLTTVYPTSASQLLSTTMVMSTSEKN